MISKLDLWIFRIVTYVNLPLNCIIYLYGMVLYPHNRIANITLLFISIIFMLCLHFKIRFLYWLYYVAATLAVLMYLSMIVALFEILRSSNIQSSIMLFMCVIDLAILLFTIFRWHKVKVLFNKTDIEPAFRSNWYKDLTTEGGVPHIISIIIAYKLVAFLYVIYTL